MRRLYAPVAVGVVLLLSQAAWAATVNVSVVDDAFLPATAQARQADRVVWTNNGGDFHTATSYGAAGTGTSGPALWDSGGLSPDETFGFTFTTAGKYQYLCRFHSSMNGVVAVPVKASPATGTVGTQFTITWGSAAPPTGYNVDVQIKRPGSTTWSNWRTNQTVRRATFTPDAGTGRYQFRARLQKGTGGASLYSAAKSITVS